MASELLHQIRLHGAIPRHIAIIMDGNGRWARGKGLLRSAGHRQGMNAVREVIEGAVEAGIEVLTLFAFSTENWQRPRVEISALMGLLTVYARQEGKLQRETRQKIDDTGMIYSTSYPVQGSGYFSLCDKRQT